MLKSRQTSFTYFVVMERERTGTLLVQADTAALLMSVVVSCFTSSLTCSFVKCGEHIHPFQPSDLLTLMGLYYVFPVNQLYLSLFFDPLEEHGDMLTKVLICVTEFDISYIQCRPR